MVTLFRKILIRLGKIIPFVFAFVVSLSYMESIYSVSNEIVIADTDDGFVYYLPISNYVGNIVYIDGFDVLLVWILCFALELCKYSFRCAYLITLNLPFRWLVEHFCIESVAIVGLASFMALAGLYCVCGGIKILLSSLKQ